VRAEENDALDAIAAESDRRKKERFLPRSATTRRAWFFGLSTAAAALVLAAVTGRVVIHRRTEPKSASDVVDLLLAQQRPFESRMSNEPHRPLVRTRSADETGVSYELLAAEMTSRSADAHQLGRFYLLQKDFGHAIPYLELAQREVGAGAAVH